MASKLLLLYTGGTIGMVEDPRTGALQPFNFSQLREHVPELNRFNHLQIDVVTFDVPVDSSDMNITYWKSIGKTIYEAYPDYDGFVILHGSDTMSFTASALSFMFQHLAKPILLTGSQLPIGMIRTDGKENLITAIEIASDASHGIPMVQEVAIYFEYRLFRGNRTHKFNSEHFNAFVSPNYPVLAKAGVNIDYTPEAILQNKGEPLSYSDRFSDAVAVLKLYPGISLSQVEYMLNTPGLRGVLMESFGAGNGPSDPAFVSLLEAAHERGICLFNRTQCDMGRVIHGKYKTSRGFIQAGVISAEDMTYEAAITKLMWAIGNSNSVKETELLLQTSLAGELSML